MSKFFEYRGKTFEAPDDWTNDQALEAAQKVNADIVRDSPPSYLESVGDTISEYAKPVTGMLQSAGLMDPDSITQTDTFKKAVAQQKPGAPTAPAGSVAQAASDQKADDSLLPENNPDNRTVLEKIKSGGKGLAINTIGGGMAAIDSALATYNEAAGDSVTAQQYDDAKNNWEGLMQQYGGDTVLGQGLQTIGSLAPAYFVPAVRAAEIAAYAGFYGVPSFRDTLKQKLDDGQSFPAALAHATENFALNTIAPELLKKGGPVLNDILGASTASGVTRAALSGVQQAAIGAGFNAATTVSDKATDEAFGEKNNNDWIDPQGLASGALAFGMLGLAHGVRHLNDQPNWKINPSQDIPMKDVFDDTLHPNADTPQITQKEGFVYDQQGNPVSNAPMPEAKEVQPEEVGKTVTDQPTVDDAIAAANKVLDDTNVQDTTAQAIATSKDQIDQDALLAKIEAMTASKDEEEKSQAPTSSTVYNGVTNEGHPASLKVTTDQDGNISAVAKTQTDQGVTSSSQQFPPGTSHDTIVSMMHSDNGFNLIPNKPSEEAASVQQPTESPYERQFQALSKLGNKNAAQDPQMVQPISVTEAHPSEVLSGGQPAIRATNWVAKAFGLEPVYFKDINGNNHHLPDGGHFRDDPSDNRIFLNAEGTQSPLAVALHEGLGHAMRTEAPDVYDAFRLSILPLLKDRAETSKVLEHEEGFSLDSDRGEEELLSNIISDQAHKPEFWTEVAKNITESHGPGMATKLFKVLQKIFDKAISWLKDMDVRTGFNTDRHFAQEKLEQVRKAAAKAAADYYLWKQKNRVSEGGPATPEGPLESKSRKENSDEEPPTTMDPKEVEKLKLLGLSVRGDEISGAPPFVKTFKDVKAQVKKAVNDALSDQAHPEDRVWYREAGRAIREYSHGDPALQEKMTRIVAKLSQGAAVNSNVSQVIKAAYQIAKGETPAVGRFPNTFRDQFGPLVEAPSFDISLKGVNTKLQNFYRNLHDETFQKNDWPNAAVIDRHAINYIWQQPGKDTVASDAQYNYAEKVIQMAAKEYNKKTGEQLKPRDMQALLWGHWKRREEGFKTETTEAGGAWNYPQFFERATANVTAEVIPSKLLPGGAEIEKWSYPEKTAFQQKALDVIFKDGQNELAKKAGLLLYKENPGSGGYEDNLNPNHIIRALALKEPAMESDRFARYSYEAIDKYARGWQYIYQQDGVPWFRADVTLDPADLDKTRARQLERKEKGLNVGAEPPKASLGYYFVFDHDLSHEEEKKFYDQLKLDLGVNAGYTKVAANRFAIINFRDENDVPYLLPDKEFKKALKNFEYNINPSEVINYGAESRYHAHDFGQDPTGVGLESEALNTGGPEWLQFLRDRRSAFNALVESEIAKHNREQPRGSDEPLLSKRRFGEEVVKLYKTLGEDEEDFAYPKVNKPTFKDTLDTLNERFKVDRPVKNRSGIYETKIMTPTGRPAFMFEKPNGEIWINVAQLRSGEDKGSAIYAAANDYAHYNNKLFMGDDAGFSDHALLRRTENMLSSAIKYGSTKHMLPHMKQTNPGLYVGTYDAGSLTPIAKGFKWDENDDFANIANMALASYHNIRKVLPEVDAIEYDPKRDSFTWPDGGPVDFESFTGDRVPELLRDRGHGDLVTPASQLKTDEREGHPFGSRTLKRAILTSSLLRQQSLEAREQLLSELGDRVRGKHSSINELLMSKGRKKDDLKQIFYSPLAKAVEKAPPKMDNQPASQWRVWLDSNASKTGVKKDELEWSGIKDWLQTQGKTKISRQEITDYLKQGGVQIAEVLHVPEESKFNEFKNLADAYGITVEKHFDEVNMSKSNGQSLDFDELPRKLQDFYNELEENPNTQYGGYVLPNGKDYRELLLTLPKIKGAGVSGEIHFANENNVDDFLSDISAAGLERYDYGRIDDNPLQVHFTDIPRSVFNNFKAHAQQNDGVAFSTGDSNNNVKAFQSDHWEHDNVLAHIRFNTRHTPDRKKVLFLEEIQSDWAQQGRKVGFEGETLTALPDGVELQELSDNDASRWGMEKYNVSVKYKGTTFHEASHLSLEKAKEYLLNKINNYIKDRAISPAPFVTDTKSWTTLSLKRMIAYAVEHGFDKIAWSTGKQNNDRYKLSDQISSMSFQDNSSGGIGNASLAGEPSSGVFTARDRNGKEVISKYMAPDEVENYIGKELASKLFNSTPEQARHAGIGVRKFSLAGIDLEVGGEGMKEFYDKLLPQVASDLIKKTNGKLRNIMLDNITNEPTAAIRRPMDAERLKTQMSPQTGFDITPEMKQQVEEGLPLFSQRRKPSEEKPSDERSSGAHLTPPEETRGEAFQRSAQDDFNRWRVVQDFLKEKGIDIGDTEDVYLAHERYPGIAGARLEDFKDKVWDPLVVQAKKDKVNLNDVATYLHAMHAEERNAQIAKINPSRPDGGSGMDNATARATLDNLKGKKNFNDIKNLAEQFRAVTDDTKNILLDSGIISQEMADTWDRTYNHYVPLKGGDEDSPTNQGTGPGMAPNGRQRRAMGHSAREENVLENIYRDHQRAIIAAEKNEVGKSLLSLIAKVGEDESLWSVDKPQKRQVLTNAPSQYEVYYHGSLVDTYNSLKDARKFVSSQITSGRKNNDFNVVKVTGDPRVQWRASNMMDENEVPVYIKGHMIRVQLHDPLLARAYKGLGTNGLGLIMDMSRNVISFLTKAYTGYNPTFIPKNMIRDFQTGLINLSGQYGARLAGRAVADYPKSFAEIFHYAVTKKSNAMLDRYRLSGGKTSAAYLSDVESIAKDMANTFDKHKNLFELIKDGRTLRAVLHPFVSFVRGVAHIIELFNQASENAMRYAAFKAALEEGMSTAQAASIAKNVSVNFNRRGEIGKEMNSAWIFFNASVQSDAQVLKTLAKGDKKQLAWILSMGLAALGLGLRATMSQQDWDNISPSIRIRNMVYKMGDKIITLPMSYEYSIFYSLGASMPDLLKGGKNAEKAALRLASAFLDSFSPIGNPVGAENLDSKDIINVAPTIPQIILNLAFNHNPLGGDIAPEDRYDPSKPDSMKMHRDTKGSVFESITSGLNNATGGTPYTAGLVDMSPESLRYLWNELTGGTGKFLMDTGMLTYNALHGVTPDAKEIPVYSSFVREAAPIESTRREFFQRFEEAQNAAAEEQRPRKALDMPAYAGLLQKDSKTAAMAKVGQEFSKIASLYKDRADMVMRDESMPLQGRRDKVKDLQHQESKILNAFISVYDKEQE